MGGGGREREIPGRKDLGAGTIFGKARSDGTGTALKVEGRNEVIGSW